jgi:adenylate cyclase
VLCIPVGEKAPYSGVLYLNLPSGSEGELEGLLDLCNAVAHLIHTGVEKYSLRERGPDEATRRRDLLRFFPPDLAERRMGALRGGEAPGWEDRAISAVRVELAHLGTAMEAGPGRAGEVIRDFLAHAAAVVYSYEGTVLQRSGDGLVAMFGAPEGQADHALRAVRVALAMRMDWARYLSKATDLGAIPLRAGVATGRALVGLAGPDPVLDYTAAGDAIGTATLLTATAAPGQILMTGKTLAAVGARFEVTPLGSRALRAGGDRVPTFEVLEEDSFQTTEPGADST